MTGAGGHDIDPNTTLERMVELARVVQHSTDAVPSVAQDAAFTLAEHVIDMHEWLRKGGFLPADWFGERRTHGTRCPQHAVPFELVHTVDAAQRWMCPMGCLMTIWTGKNGHGDLLVAPANGGTMPRKICGYRETRGEDSTVTVICTLGPEHLGDHAL